MLKGCVDIISWDHLSGWCYDDERPEARFAIGVLHDGREIASGMADKWRGDLCKICASGNISFAIQASLQAYANEITVMAKADDGTYTELPVAYNVFESFN